MELIVVDASVAAKWVLTEPETPIALELLHGEARLAAPGIIKLEVTGAVLRRFREGKLELEPARLACDDWHDILHDAFLHVIAIDDLYESAVKLAFEARHALADSFYIAAAKQLDATLLTAEPTLEKRARLVHDKVKLLPKAA